MGDVPEAQRRPGPGSGICLPLHELPPGWSNCCRWNWGQLSAAVLIRNFYNSFQFSHHVGSQLFHQFLESFCASPGPHSSMAWLEDKSVIIWDVKNEQARSKAAKSWWQHSCAAFRWDSHFPWSRLIHCRCNHENHETGHAAVSCCVSRPQ